MPLSNDFEIVSNYEDLIGTCLAVNKTKERDIEIGYNWTVCGMKDQ
jgi:hypothetical protein